MDPNTEKSESCVVGGYWSDNMVGYDHVILRFHLGELGEKLVDDCSGGVGVVESESSDCSEWAMMIECTRHG